MIIHNVVKKGHQAPILNMNSPLKGTKTSFYKKFGLLTPIPYFKAMGLGLKGHRHMGLYIGLRARAMGFMGIRSIGA